MDAQLATPPPAQHAPAPVEKADVTSAPPLARHALYLELGGSSYYASANYEWRALRSLSIRGGLGYFHSACEERCVEIFTLPLLANVLLGPGNHVLELAAGAVPLISSDRPFRLGWLATAVGYRYQPLAGGFLLRVTFTPLAYFYMGSPRVQPWAGVSAGASF